MRTCDLKMKRKEHMDEMEKIVNLAMRENRNLTTSEVNSYEKNKAELVALDKRIEASNTLPFTLDGGGNSNVRYGQPIGLESRFAALPDVRNTDGPLDMRKLMRGYVTGNWQDADAELRAQQTIGTGSLGGYLVPSPIAAQVIDLARNKCHVMRAGARTIPMDATTLDLATLDGDPTAYWRAEGTAITESGATFGTKTLTAKALGCLTSTTVEFLEDAQDGGDVMINAMAQALALELDRAAIHGSGSGAEPTGILNTSGIGSQSMGTDGAAITGYSEILAAMGDVTEANFVPNAIMMAPRTDTALASLIDSNGVSLVAPDRVSKLLSLVTNQVSTSMTQGNASNASAIIVGQWDQLAIGIRNNLQIELFRGSDDAISKMEVYIRAYIRADVVLVRPAAMSAVVGIIPAT